MGVDVTTYLVYGIKLEREYHFHNLNCLIKWKKIEETNERQLTIERERAIQNTE